MANTATAPATTVTPRAQQAYAYFIAKGLTPAQAAGIVGNMQAESGVNIDPEAKNSIGCIGIVQWCYGRRPFNLVTGNPDADFAAQLDHVWSEMNGNESRSLTLLRQATTPQQAATVFEAAFERSGGALLARRQANAAAIFGAAINGAINAVAPPTASTDTTGTTGATDVGFGLSNIPIIGGVFSSLDFLNKVWKLLTSRTFWIRFGEILLGTGLLFAGIFLMASESNALAGAKSAATTAAVAAA